MTAITYDSPRTLLYGIGVAAMMTVVPLLGWVWGLGSFATLFWGVSVPGLLVVVAGVAVAVRRYDDRAFLDVVSVSLVAGVVGTLAYDLFRVPFVFGLGLRLLSPIESYGVLLLDAGGSSGVTDFAGWIYHFANGIGFALAYGMFAAGRHWAWGVVWAMVLETAAVVTPFADAYALRGKTWPIMIAYAAHVPYGMTVGWFLQNPRRSADALRNVVPRPALVTVVGLTLALAVWLDPWGWPSERGSAVIVSERLEPEFTRTDSAGCVNLRNRDATRYYVTLDGEEQGEIMPGTTRRFCVERRGVLRLRVSQRPFDGGFIINS